MRLFLAIDPDARARDALGGLRTAAERAMGEAALAWRWTGQANVHLTLHFLGEVDEARVPPLVAALGGSLREPPFDATLGRLGVFPPSGPPRTLWVSVAGAAEALGRVHRELAARLEGAGGELDARPFTPHLTLARVRERDRRLVRNLGAVLSAIAVPSVSWRVDEVVLFLSDLSGAAPRYTALHRLPLRMS
jgi:2'-5' RNA ligase